MGDRWETGVGWYCSYWDVAVVGSLDRSLDCRTDRIAVVGSLNRRRIDCRTDRTWAAVASAQNSADQIEHAADVDNAVVPDTVAEPAVDSDPPASAVDSDPTASAAPDAVAEAAETSTTPAAARRWSPPYPTPEVPPRSFLPPIRVVPPRLQPMMFQYLFVEEKRNQLWWESLLQMDFVWRLPSFVSEVPFSFVSFLFVVVFDHFLDLCLMLNLLFLLL